MSSMALFSSPTHFPTLSPSSSHPKPQLTQKPYLFLRSRTPLFRLHFTPKAATDNGAGALGSAATAEPSAEPKVAEPSKPPLEKQESSAGENGAVATKAEVLVEKYFEDPKWVNGTWDLKQFQKDGKPDWDAVIDAAQHVNKLNLLQYNSENLMDQMLKAAAEEGNIDKLYTLFREDPYLLERIDHIPFVDTPLHIAASLGHTQFVMEFMRLKPSFARKQNQDGFSPVRLALQHGKTMMGPLFFAVFWALNMITHLITVLTIVFLLPSGQISTLLLVANYLFSYCFALSMLIISPVSLYPVVNYVPLSTGPFFIMALIFSYKLNKKLYEKKIS